MIVYETIKEFMDSLYLRLYFDDSPNFGIGRCYIMCEGQEVGHTYLNMDRQYLFYHESVCRKLCVELRQPAFVNLICQEFACKFDVLNSSVFSAH